MIGRTDGKVPANYARRLTGRVRSRSANIHLGLALAFIAGATNAGGFLAVHQYTSHMTGVMSAMADNMALGSMQAVLAGIGVLAAFIGGAACTAILVNFARRRDLDCEYALPLTLEAGLLLCFGLLGDRLAGSDGLAVSVTVTLLAFIMGLQNAVISKLSNTEIRTTHVTGMMTDIGIELGKLLYRSTDASPATKLVTVNRRRLSLLTLLVLFFFAGGVAGAAGFRHLGYIATVPLAMFLLALAIVPVVDDMRALWRRPGDQP